MIEGEQKMILPGDQPTKNFENSKDAVDYIK